MIELGKLQLLAPAWLALTLVPVLLGLFRRNREQRVLAYADPELRPWVVLSGGQRGDRRRGALLAAGWILLALALADPRIPVTTPEGSSEDKAGHPLPVMVVLEVSPAMDAEDISPSRGERARRLISDLLPRLSGERLGLVVYSADAGRLLPPTQDTALLEHFVAMAPEALSDRPGSNLASALRLAAEEPALSDGGAVLLLTAADQRSFRGERGNAVFSAARLLAQREIGLFTLIIAEKDGAPVHDALGAALQDEQGQPWISRPDLAAVQEMTRLASGQWQQIRDNRNDIVAVRDFLAAQPLPGDLASDAAVERRPLYAWLLLPALLLFLAAQFPGLGRATRATTSMWFLAMLVLPLAPGSSGEARADTAVQGDTAWRAWQAWQNEDWASAQLDFSGLKGYQARFGEGAAAYRREDFAHARDQFRMAMLLAASVDQRADALFNLGNALFRLGQFAGARDAYAGVLVLRPDDEGAARNHYLAGERLAELQKRIQDEEPPGERPTDFARYEEEDESDFPPEDEGGPLEAIGADAGAGAGRRDAGDDEPYRFDPRALDSARKKLELVRDEPTDLIGQLIRQQAVRRGDASP
ncbi:MAG: VWA domain-containing protein [Halothiobacillaceae bacterium]